MLLAMDGHSSLLGLTVGCSHRFLRIGPRSSSMRRFALFSLFFGPQVRRMTRIDLDFSDVGSAGAWNWMHAHRALYRMPHNGTHNGAARIRLQMSFLL